MKQQHSHKLNWSSNG